MSAEALAALHPRPLTPAIVVPVPVEPSGRVGGPDRATSPRSPTPPTPSRRASTASSPPGHGHGGPARTLVVAGQSGSLGEGAEGTGLLDPAAYRALLRRARVFVAAPRREDYGIAQLEALADGCRLVTTPAPGPYAALPLARTLDARLVGEDLAPALRTALDTPADDYAERAAALLAPYRQAAFEATVHERVLPALLG